MRVLILFCAGFCSAEWNIDKYDEVPDYPLEVGDECKLTELQNGVCTRFLDCGGAELSIKRHVKPPICSFHGKEPIICCQKTNNLKNSLPERIQESPELQFARLCNDTYSKYGTKLPPRGILGGRNAGARQYPHMAALGFRTKDDDGVLFACGGCLITDRFVLTAAHCLSSRDYGDVEFVRLGDLDLKADTDDAEPQNFTIIRRIRHPLYKSASKYHDIALIELDRPVNQTDYVMPACVQFEREMSEIDWTANGWGSIGYGQPPSDKLQVVYLKPVEYDTCKKFYGESKSLRQGLVDDWQICAGDLSADTCQGDSGGPLQNRLINSIGFIKGHSIIGITSFGKACGVSTSPGVYTRVSNYIDWIASVVFADRT